MMRSRPRERTAVQRPEHGTHRRRRKPEASARYCIQRIEGERGEQASWIVHIVPSQGGHASHFAILQRGGTLDDHGDAQDGALATWDAMCLIEQRMRERRGDDR